MALNKTPIDINFSQGLDLKTDPFQVPVGKFLKLVNSVFTKTGQLTKREGFAPLAALPTTDVVTATTLSGNLVAIGTDLQTYSADINKWINKGPIQPVKLEISPQVRTNTTQLTVDTTVASNGLSCTTWYDSNTSSYYRITDNATGQVIVDTTALTASASATYGPKVFCLGKYFVILYWQTITATPTLRYLAIPVGNPTNPGTPTSIIAGSGITASFDGQVAPLGNLYISLKGAANTIKTVYITPSLSVSASVTISSSTVLLISSSVDTTGNYWVTWSDSGGTPDVTFAVYDRNLNVIKTATALAVSTGTINHLTTIARAGVLTLFIEEANTYSYTPNSPHTANSSSNFITTLTYTLATTTESAATVLLRSVGIASKAFYLPSTDTIYLLTTYGGLMQPTYFLVDQIGNIICKLAYSNGAGYLPSGNLPGASVVDQTVKIGYLFKDLTTAVNKTTALPANSQVAGIYNQVGINLAAFTFMQGGIVSAELAGSLHTIGGFLWQYDGVKPVEHSFHVYPEDIGTATATTGGLITADTYYYSATYEWTDAQGLIHRSAPSVPTVQVVPAGTSTNANTINIPTLRLTYKTAPNPVRIVLYRWSTHQPVYYQVTSILAPVTNSTTTDSVTISDTLADSAILGNTILYTNGGVIENIAAPAITSITPFNTRLFAIDAEDQNLLWYSKQVIENTPVEMSDLFTLYVAPTISAQGSTGPMKCLSAMDDKLIIFKKDAIYYVTGTGPDNTGAQNDLSTPVFITSTVGCANQESIVFMPNGLMFQSDKGIWLLGRDLSTSYIGAGVADYNDIPVVAANNIPGTNQVRFRLSDGTTLMYDYYYNQWGTFQGIKGISSTIYQSLETVITAAQVVSPPNQNPYTLSPEVYQQTPGKYLDGTQPVLMSFQTGWISLAGIQGYERFYQLLFLGNYISPFKLNTQFAYDFNPSVTQAVLATPETPGPIYGLASGPYGSGNYGGPATAFKARVFPDTQKCESFQVAVNELYDSQYDIAAGGGLTLSGMQLLVGVKKGSRTQSASRSFG